MTWEFIVAKVLNTALILFFFAAIIFFLRFLYGPKGRFRDPQWDQWNEEARLALERELDGKADERLREAFTAYASSWFSGDAKDDGPLRLKLEHTYKVCAHAEELARLEPSLADRDVARALRLAALFHDVARFEQYVRYKTFADDLSCNHGVMGAKILMRKGFLKKEPGNIRRLVLAAVAMHNRFALPHRLPDKLRLVLEALRDADKLDILRIMEEHLQSGACGDGVVLLHLKDEPHSYSPAVLTALEQGRAALYRDMRFYNDFRILLCTWVFDLHFPASLRIVKRAGHLERIIDGLSALPEVRATVRGALDARLDSAARNGGNG